MISIDDDGNIDIHDLAMIDDISPCFVIDIKCSSFKNAIKGYDKDDVPSLCSLPKDIPFNKITVHNYEVSLLNLDASENYAVEVYADSIDENDTILVATSEYNKTIVCDLDTGDAIDGYAAYVSAGYNQPK